MSTHATPTLSLRGIGASPGVAVGHAFVMDRATDVATEPGLDTSARTSAILEPVLELFSARRRAS